MAGTRILASKGRQLLSVYRKVFANKLKPSCLSTEEKWVVHSKDADVEIPNVTYSQFLFDGIEKHAHRVYMVNGEDGSSYTFSEARERSLRFSSALARLGVAKGDVVAIISPNCPEYFIGVLGTISLGAIITPVSPSFTSDEMWRQLKDSDSSVVICHEDCLKNATDAMKNIKNIRLLILIGKERDNFFSFHKMLKDDGNGTPGHIEMNASEDVAALFYSSGTTGLPKGVMLTHRSIVANVYQSNAPGVLPCNRGLEEPQDTFQGVLPFYHIYGFYVYFSMATFFGAKVITQKKYDTAVYAELISKYKVTVLYVVPPILSALCADKRVTPAKLSSVRATMCGAAPLGQTLKTKFYQKFGESFDFCEAYGMTELSPLSHMTRKGQTVVSGFQSIPNTLTKIVDLRTGQSIGPGEEGEICVKGPQVMKGYWKNPEATKQAITEDGWLHTGDIARMDDQGNIFIVDRLKELIKVKGFQVAPAELEDLLRKHPSVEDVAVIGIPDEAAGEIPKAFIKPAEGHFPSEEEIVGYVHEKVSPYKRLKGGVVFVDQIPKSASGKILRRVLKQQMVEGNHAK